MSIPRLGTTINPYGKLVAIGMRDRERFYMFEDADGTVSLIPELASARAAHAERLPLTPPHAE